MKKALIVFSLIICLFVSCSSEISIPEEKISTTQEKEPIKQESSLKTSPTSTSKPASNPDPIQCTLTIDTSKSMSSDYGTPTVYYQIWEQTPTCTVPSSAEDDPAWKEYKEPITVPEGYYSYRVMGIDEDGCIWYDTPAIGYYGDHPSTYVHITGDTTFEAILAPAMITIDPGYSIEDVELEIKPLYSWYNKAISPNEADIYIVDGKYVIKLVDPGNMYYAVRYTDNDGVFHAEEWYEKVSRATSFETVTRQPRVSTSYAFYIEEGYTMESVTYHVTEIGHESADEPIQYGCAPWFGVVLDYDRENETTYNLINIYATNKDEIDSDTDITVHVIAYAVNNETGTRYRDEKDILVTAGTRYVTPFTFETVCEE